MDNVISEYQRWKQQGEALRAQARQAMETRFRELLGEAMQIAQEYHKDFGGVLKPPPPVTAFRFKAGARSKAKKAGKAKAAVRPAAPPPPPPKPAAPAKADPKVARLEKKLAAARQKLEGARTAGTPTKNLEDRVYEIEDDLRLATAGV